MKPPAKTRRVSAAERFRREIEKATAEGVSPGDMTLRLTWGDATQLKRDPTVAVSEISFSGGVMRFLGVKVEEGVPESALQQG